MSESCAIKFNDANDAVVSGPASYTPGTIRDLLEKHLSYTPLGCNNSAKSANSLHALAETVKRCRAPVTEMDAEIAEFALDHLRIIRQQNNEHFRHACLDSVKAILLAFNTYFQQNREVQLEVLQIHMMSSNRGLASAARFEFNQLRNSTHTKLETW